MAMTPDPHTSRPTGREDSVAPLGRKFLWADTSAGVNRLIIGLMVICVLLFAVELVYHRHTKVPVESLYGFHAIAGFVSFTVIVLGARLLRLIIRRDESYYQPYGVDAEDYPAQGTQRLMHEQVEEDSVKGFIGEMAGRKPEDSA
ncbi:MAG: hypothetical protein AB8B63_02255 [Granulosicoccus sp.]